MFFHNRGKINPGCEKVYANVLKRKCYFELQKEIARKYEYETVD